MSSCGCWRRKNFWLSSFVFEKEKRVCFETVTYHPKQASVYGSPLLYEVLRVIC